jgi:hypothetical protein
MKQKWQSLSYDIMRFCAKASIIQHKNDRSYQEKSTGVEGKEYQEVSGTTIMNSSLRLW